MVADRSTARAYIHSDRIFEYTLWVFGERDLYSTETEQIFILQMEKEKAKP